MSKMYIPVYARAGPVPQCSCLYIRDPCRMGCFSLRGTWVHSPSTRFRLNPSRRCVAHLVQCRGLPVFGFASFPVRWASRGACRAHTCPHRIRACRPSCAHEYALACPAVRTHVTRPLSAQEEIKSLAHQRYLTPNFNRGKMELEMVGKAHHQ